MARIDEAERLRALSQIDRGYWETPDCVLAGMDEVGRGPLAGPVAAACVVLPPEPLIRYVNDSKKVTKLRREAAYEQILNDCLVAKTVFVDEKRIDQINILNATKEAFALAFAAANEAYTERFGRPISDVMIDALTGLAIPAKQHSLIHGDALCYSIAAASIVAKVERDRLMEQMDQLYPGYGFARNVGYGTREHIDALQRLGPCPIHRQSFIGKFLCG